MSTDPKSAVGAVRQPLQTVIRNNSAAFGFSIMITGSLATIAERHGAPHPLQIMLFGLASIASFTMLDLLVTEGFTENFTSAPPEVVCHAASLSFVSVGLGLGAAIGMAHLLGGTLVWPLASFVATTIFVLASGFELALAESLSERENKEAD